MIFPTIEYSETGQLLVNGSTREISQRNWLMIPAISDKITSLSDKKAWLDKLKLVQVKVTKKHIESGDQCMANACPVAKAIFEAIGWQKLGVFLYLPIAQIQRGNQTLKYQVPKRAIKFIKAFDRYGPVKPFSFWLMVPKKWKIA